MEHYFEIKKEQQLLLLARNVDTVPQSPDVFAAHTYPGANKKSIPVNFFESTNTCAFSSSDAPIRFSSIPVLLLVTLIFAIFL